MPTCMAPIGLYDSGVGGLSVVREVMAQLPREAYYYLGDTARVPYGGRPGAELIKFNREILAYLASEGAKAVLVACNTSCATAMEALRAECPVPLVGLIDAGARSALAVGRRIAVLATEATVKSGAYLDAIQAIEPGAEIVLLACPTLVPLVERGIWTGSLALETVRDAIGLLSGLDIDAAILGCTHYPLLKDAIQEVLGSRVILVDPAAEAVREMAEMLRAADLLAPEGATPGHQMVVTGDEESFGIQAHHILSGPTPPVRRVFLETLRLAGDRLEQSTVSL